VGRLAPTELRGSAFGLLPRRASFRCRIKGINLPIVAAGESSWSGIRIDPDVMFGAVDQWLAMTGRPTAAVEPGSPLAGDARRSPELQVAHAAYSAIVNAVDHLHALKTLIQDARVVHTHAPFTLLRAATEASATAVWLLDPPSRQERLRRRLKLGRHEAWEAGKARELMPQHVLGSVRSAGERIEAIKALARTNDIEPSEVCGQFSYEQVVRRAGDTTKLGGDMAALLWRLCSGFAHGREWAALGFLERRELEKVADVVSLQLTSDVGRVLLITQAPYLFTQRAVQLFDQRRRSPFAA